MKTAIKIDAVIVEVDGTFQADIDFETADKKRINLSRGNIGVIDEEVKATVLKSLVESNQARIISRPTIITLDGRPANIHVGGIVTVPFGENRAGVEREIGVKLDVIPKTAGKNVILDIDCDYSRLNGKDRIETQTLETKFEVGDGQTIVLSGAGSNRLILFLTPKNISTDFLQAAAVPMQVKESPATKSKPQLLAVPNRSMPQPALPQPAVSLPPVLQFSQPKAPTPPSTDSQRVLGSPVTTNSPRPATASLEEALERLFPTEKVDVMYLPNAIVLTGSVSEKWAPGIITIAEQYSPTVIAHLNAETPKLKIESPGDDANGIGEQLERLHNDVLLLRKEVKKVTELLQSKPLARQSSAVEKKPSGLRQMVAGPVKAAESHERPDMISQTTGQFANYGTQEIRVAASTSLKSPQAPWHLTLEEVISITQQNFGHETPDKLSGRLEKCRSLYSLLGQAQKELAASTQANEFNTSTAYHVTGLEIAPTVNQRQQLAATRAQMLRMRRTEGDLRDQMGLADADGRLITANR
ncbi:MAG: hypothetical protein KDB00_24810 [Planctomycetales bacterium]|nr:hypothetical protein [Planctomycetales bacterium]